MNICSKIKNIMKEIANVFGTEFVKNPTAENAMKWFFTNTLRRKDTSFAILGIRCNSEQSTGKRKISPMQIYYFLQGYKINEASIEMKKEQQILNTLYDDFYSEGVNGIPHIQVSAIVGQNGSGKSSIVEFMMRLINNFAAATIGELQNSGKASDHLHFVDGVDGEIWYILEGYAYQLKVKNCSVKLFKFKKNIEDKEGKHFTEPKRIFDNEKSETCEVLDGPHTSIGDEELKKLYQCFFYTLISNQSIYAYNTLDFESECNSDEKEALVLGDGKTEKYNTEDKCWLHGLFHKNDAYRTPLVITPFRREGNIDINNERELAIERLVRLYALHEDLRTINDHLLMESLTYSYNPENQYGIDRVKRKLYFKNLSEKGYAALKNDIMAKWSKAIGRNLSIYNTKSYYNEAIEYLVYKTLKVSYQYKEHWDFYDAACMMTDVYNSDTLGELVDALSKDHSHITRKIYQTLGYLMFDVYDFGESVYINRNDNELKNTIGFKQLGNKWWEATKLSHEEMKTSLLLQLRLQAIVPPPFFSIKINLCEKDNEQVKIDFETLSSGEKQQIFTISSILYHLDNIDSAHKDQSAANRVQYNNVCIVLEEIELYYHPQLQQQFIYYFLNGLKEITLENIKSIHLIIVTHSPYVLSDIPRTNVLALKKDETESVEGLRSFGANVYDMLKDSFFLEGGAMGMFAQWEVTHLMACMKIHQWAKDADDTKECPFIGDEEVYAFLNRYLYLDTNDKNRKSFSYDDYCHDFSSESIKERIMLIDEPVVYHVLMDEFTRTFPSLSEEQKQLKREDLLRQLNELDKM